MPEMSLEELAKQFGRQIPWANKSLPEATQERLQQIDGQGMRDPVANAAAHAISLHPAVQLAMGALPLVTNPNRDTFQNALDTIQNTSVGGKVGSEAMVPSLGNLKRFEEIKEGIRQQLIKDNPFLEYKPNYTEAASYIGARYPRHYNQPTDITPTYRMKGNDDARGLFHPEEKIVPKVGRVVVNYNQPLDGLINTIAHETTHAVDLPRKGIDFLLEGRDAYDKAIGRGPHDIDLYNQLVPSEARAYRAGDTAEMGYEKYLALKNRPVDPMIQSTTPPPPTTTPAYQDLLDRVRPRNVTPTY